MVAEMIVKRGRDIYARRIWPHFIPVPPPKERLCFLIGCTKNIYHVGIHHIMDLSAAYGAAFFAAPLGMTNGALSSSTAATVATKVTDSAPTTTELEQPSVPRTKRAHKPTRFPDGSGIYAIHVEIGRDEAHLLMIFIAVLILSLLFSAKK